MSPAEQATLELKVRAPQSDPDDDPREFSYNRGTKVGDAAEEAAQAYGFATDTQTWTFMLESEEVLDPNSTLASEDIEDDDTVTLTDFGRGV